MIAAALRRGSATQHNFNKAFHILRNSPKKPSRRIAVSPEVSKILDHAADKIRLADDFYSRQCAIDEFKMICRDTQSAINPGREALRRGVSLMNHLEVVSG